MPILGLTERRRMPRLGKIRLGVKETSVRTGNPYPRAVDYFVCPPEVQAICGDKPRELLICFPVEDEAQFAQQWYRRYSSSRGLICKGDGETCGRLIDKATGDFAHADTKEVVFKEDMPCSGEGCPEYEAKRCRRVMNLQFLLPTVPGLGVWQLDTSSLFSILNINSAVSLVRATLGRVAMIPLTLAVVPQEVTPRGGKKKTVYVLQLQVTMNLIEAQRLAAISPTRVMLPPPEVSEEEPSENGNGAEVQMPSAEERPEELFPDEVITDVPLPFSPPKAPPGPTSTVTQEGFYEAMKAEGISPAKVCELLTAHERAASGDRGITYKTLQDWLAPGGTTRTLARARDIVFKGLGKALTEDPKKLWE